MTGILRVLNLAFLDQLIRKYVDYHDLDKNYVYSIVKTDNDSVIFSSSVQLAKQEKSEYSQSLPA